ncbi:MAG TPA: PrsW family intramembrane metalloprotease [Marmoricola sp.]|jgi:RsiW-degrading membrane proteinase PrsW (M82 family)|nr:PrsW family intramembrane metalloprotease [Marmoricola sp.]
MQKRRRGNLAFTLITGLAMFVGAGVMALVVIASGAPAAVAISLLLAALPVFPLVACYLWLDRYEPEPRGLLVLGLGWGAFAATAIALVLQVADAFSRDPDPTLSAVVVAPFTEEASKGLFILLLLWFRRAELDGVLDGIVYAGMVGIGFAFTENILYLMGAYLGTDSGTGGIESAVGLFIMRCIFSPFAHPFFTAFTGVGIGIAVAARSRGVKVLAPLVGYLVAVAAHALWNASLYLRDGAYAFLTYLFLLVPAFLLLVAFALWSRRQEGKILALALTDCARRGLLHPNEVPWLVRIPGRRAARRHAEQVGGEQALEAMKDYQEAAIELGYLHHRYLRGTAPQDYAVLGQEHVEQLFRLRPFVVWPQSGPAVAAPGGRR